MPNFTITRQTEPGDTYGCTDFQTTQAEDTDAAIGPAPLDGDIIWNIDANPGFVVDIDDFSIPSAAPTSATQIPGLYSTWQGGLIPAPILGVVMDQITITRIKVTIYLVPSVTHGITGTLFTMPSNNVSVALPISGCAELTPEPV